MGYLNDDFFGVFLVALNTMFGAIYGLAVIAFEQYHNLNVAFCYGINPHSLENYAWGPDSAAKSLATMVIFTFCVFITIDVVIHFKLRSACFPYLTFAMVELLDLKYGIGRMKLIFVGCIYSRNIEGSGLLKKIIRNMFLFSERLQITMKASP